MKKNGFTLVELMAVLVVLAMLVAIAVPSALRIATNVKEQAYKTKIGLIEKAGVAYGQSNVATIQNNSDTCVFTYSDSEQDEYKSVTVNSSIVEEGKQVAYKCIEKTVAELVKTGNLNWDVESNCSTNKNGSECTDKYKNIVVHPSDKSIINDCKVYIYYKNKRVYAYFDKELCGTLAYENKY